MNRREFLKGLGKVTAVAGPFVAAAAILEDDPYQPVGYLDYESPGAHHIDYVTVNGERVDRVIRLNDVEGWVEHYGPIYEHPEAELTPQRDAFRTYHRRGVVRAHWTVPDPSPVTAAAAASTAYVALRGDVGEARPLVCRNLEDGRVIVDGEFPEVVEISRELLEVVDSPRTEMSIEFGGGQLLVPTAEWPLTRRFRAIRIQVANGWAEYRLERRGSWRSYVARRQRFEYSDPPAA